MTAYGRRPLVLFVTWATDPALAASLEARLDGRRVVCLGPPTDEDADGFRSVDDWLAHHLDLLGKARVDPPYLVAGYSFGGVLALEAARQLAESAPVLYLGLIDTTRPHRRPLKIREAIPYHLREAGLLPDSAAQRRYLGRELKRRIGPHVPVWIFQARRKARGLPRAEKVQSIPRPKGPLVRSIHRCYLKYVASVFEMPTHLYVTQSSIDRCSGDPSLRWAPYLRAGFSVQHIDGSHFTLGADEHVATLADAVRRHLDAVDPPS